MFSPTALSEPVLATYVEADGKGVDIVDLCRRLIGEYQYLEEKPSGKLISCERNIPIVESNLKDVKDAMTRLSGMNPFLLGPPTKTEELRAATQGKTFSRLTLLSSFGSSPHITGKNFYNKGDLSKKQVERLYWTMKLRWTCSIINQAVAQMIPELKKRGYSGFILPHGKTVSFESLHFALLEVVPREYTIFQFESPLPDYMIKMMDNKMGIKNLWNDGPTAIEQLSKVDKDHGLLVKHAVLAFNLPVESDGDQGGLFIVDPTGSQFQAWSPTGGLVNWGFWENYEKSYPVEKIIITEFEPHFCRDPTFLMRNLGPTLLHNVVNNLLLPACNFCGDVEKKNGKRSVDLKKCKGCMLAVYCDSTCQKLAWPTHKSICRSSDN
ncbi:Ubiquitin carboxyl-terminal hydrolase 19 [Orchesella cincta]|uniref:Ubiquitin carboxyl-terminal hydrolase 19 n=1 Tax=Orchesella cincta TaxID=48709 RepID=A0A1D2NHK9_ORCCI|nr:Ubiquitin carboxyl-terminal hydrolase 19 [Orchesella cincta]